MKKRAGFLLAILIFLVLPFSVVLGYVDKDQAARSAEEAYPGWTVFRSTWSGYGMEQDEIAIHSEVFLYRVDQGQLLVKALDAVTNGIEAGEAIPWREESYAPVPLNEEAVHRISGLPAEDLFDKGTTTLSDEALPGCAGFLQNEGETLTELIVYHDALVATARSERCTFVRIAHWDGHSFDRITECRAESGLVAVNDVHSNSESLEIFTDDLELFCEIGPDYVWRLSAINCIGAICFLNDDYLYAYDDFASPQNNDQYHFGHPTIQRELDQMDLSALPKSADEVIAVLDQSGFACVRRDDALMLDAPAGRLIASFYARAAGRVIREQDGYTQLQIGATEHGISGWFRTEELAFGAETEQVICAFPSYTLEGIYQAESWSEILPGVESATEPYRSDCWLIGRTAQGDWLAQIDWDIVAEMPFDLPKEIGPTEHAWEWLEDEEKDLIVESEAEEEPGLG